MEMGTEYTTGILRDVVEADKELKLLTEMEREEEHDKSNTGKRTKNGTKNGVGKGNRGRGKTKKP